MNQQKGNHMRPATISFGILAIAMAVCASAIAQEQDVGCRICWTTMSSVLPKGRVTSYQWHPTPMPLQDAEPRTLKVRIKAERYFDSTKILPVTTNQEFFGKELKSPRLMIDRETKGLAEVFVSTKREAPVSADEEREPVTHEMTIENANFSPRVMVMEAGDTLKFVGHPNVITNPNTGSLWAAGFGFAIPVGANIEGIPEEQSYDKFSPVSCAIHPWMYARIFVANKTHCRLTDELGECELPLPADATRPIKLHLMHSRLGKLKLAKDAPGIEVLEDGLQRISPGVTEIEITVQVE